MHPFTVDVTFKWMCVKTIVPCDGFEWGGGEWVRPHSSSNTFGGGGIGGGKNDVVVRGFALPFAKCGAAWGWDDDSRGAVFRWDVVGGWVVGLADAIGVGGVGNDDTVELDLEVERRLFQERWSRVVLYVFNWMRTGHGCYNFVGRGGGWQG